MSRDAAVHAAHEREDYAAVARFALNDTLFRCIRAVLTRNSEFQAQFWAALGQKSEMSIEHMFARCTAVRLEQSYESVDEILLDAQRLVASVDSPALVPVAKAFEEILHAQLAEADLVVLTGPRSRSLFNYN
jgi:hypothetical protein